MKKRNKTAIYTTLFLVLVLVLSLGFNSLADNSAGSAAGEADVLTRAAQVVNNALNAFDETHDWTTGTVAAQAADALNVATTAIANAAPPIEGVTVAWVLAPIRDGATIAEPGHFAGKIRLTLTIDGSVDTAYVSVLFEAAPKIPWNPGPAFVNRVNTVDAVPGGAANDLFRNLYALTSNYGSRLFGSRNSYDAARYIESEFLTAGIAANDVEFLVTERRDNMLAQGGANGGANSRAWNGRLMFDGLHEIYGSAFPALGAAVDVDDGAFPAIADAELVYLGTFPNALSAADADGRNIVGVVRFVGPHLSVPGLVAALGELEEYYGVEIEGIVLSRVGRVLWENAVPAVALMPGIDNAATNPFSTVVMTDYFLTMALERADSFAGMDRFQRTNDYSVFARLPATDDPDNPEMVIVVTAHKDSVLAATGASDNASGASALLELARTFVAMPDRGGVEIWFLAVSSHEGGGRPSVHEIIGRLRDQGLDDIAININMDMVATPSYRANGAPMDAIAVEIVTPGVGCGNETRIRSNLPARLLLEHDRSLWPVGIYNVRLEQCGGTDHDVFIQNGIDAANIIYLCECDNNLEIGYHNSRDNLEENYCYNRHRAIVNIVSNAVHSAIVESITKVVEFEVDFEASTITLLNANRLFETFDKVVGRIDPCGSLGNPGLPICTVANCPCVNREVVFTITYSTPGFMVTVPGLDEAFFADVRVVAIGSTDYVDHAPRAIARRGTANTPARVGPGGAEWLEHLGRFESRMREVRTQPLPVFIFEAFNNGNEDNASLAGAGLIRVWPLLNGAGTLVPMDSVITALCPDGNDAMQFISRNRQWCDASGWQDFYINFDADKTAQWQYIYLTVTAFHQTVEIRLVNNRFVAEPVDVLGLNVFNNGNDNNVSLANLGVIRIWTRLNGVNALVPYVNLVVTAELPNGDCAMQFVRVNRIWNNPGYVNLIDVVKNNAPWQYIDLTVTLGNQSVELRLINNRYTP